MSEILEEENAIILASVTKMVDTGAEAASRILNGYETKKQDALTDKILKLLTAYRSKAELDEYQLAAILYELRNLSGEDEFPSISPIVGQAVINVITANPSDLEFFDDGTSLGTGFTQVDFIGSAVTAQRSGDRLNVTVTGGVAAGAVMLRDDEWDLSTDVVPQDGGTGTLGVIERGNLFYVRIGSAGGVLGPDGGPVLSGFMALALDSPPGINMADRTKWALIPTIV